MATRKRGQTDAAQMEMLRRRREVASLYLRGLKQWEIAERVGVTQQTVSADLRATRSEWLASGLRDFDEARSNELAKIDALERTYWEAWERSCQDREVLHAKKKTGDSPSEEAGKRTEGRDGNPEFLKGVERCIQSRCKLLGLVVDKVAATTPDGRQTAGADVDPGRVAAMAREKMAEWDRLTSRAGSEGDAETAR